jgi:ribokinase
MVKNFDIVTFGSAITDIFVATDQPTANNSFNYKIGHKLLIKNLQFDIGGGATNAATAFSRFGLKTGCVCKVGNDNNGKDILELLKKEKITFLGSIGKGKTGVSIILNKKKIGRTVLTNREESDNLKSSDVKPYKTKWLYLSSLLKSSFNTQKKIVLKMAKGGTRVAFNPSEYLIQKKDIREILRVTSILILNKEEAGLLTKKYKKRGPLLHSIRSLGPKIVVITNKNEPIKAYNGIREYSIKPHKIKVIERTGAGDAFASGFVAGIMANYPIEKCLKLALEEGESVLKYFGAKNKLLKKKLRQ